MGFVSTHGTCDLFDAASALVSRVVAHNSVAGRDLRPLPNLQTCNSSMYYGGQSCLVPTLYEKSAILVVPMTL